MIARNNIGPIPAPLVNIIAATAIIVVVCFYASGLNDPRIDPAAMSSDATAARLQPLAHADVAVPGNVKH
jgi:hypothetical protein